MLISFVSPVYCCRDCLQALVEEIGRAAHAIGQDHEIILVDDNCPQGSWGVITDIARANPRVKGIRLSRNFGQHSAIEAGLGRVTGDWVVVLDCDLQDHPRALTQLWEHANQGADVVLVRRKQRRDLWHRRFLSKAFYWILSKLTGANINPEIANFGLYKRAVIDTYNSWREEQKYFPVMIQWLGFEQAVVDVPHSERFAGRSSYNLKTLFKLGARIVLSFSDRPLWLMSAVGAAVAAAAALVSCIYALRWLAGDIVVEGWASLILSVWFLGGLNVAAAGVIGIYLGRALREAKGRPSFVVSRTINLADE